MASQKYTYISWLWIWFTICVKQGWKESNHLTECQTCWLCLIVNVYKTGKVLVKWLRMSFCLSSVLWNTSPTVVPLLHRNVWTFHDENVFAECAIHKKGMGGGSPMSHGIEILACFNTCPVEATQIQKLLNIELGNVGHRSLPPGKSYRVSQLTSLDHFLAAPALCRQHLVSPHTSRAGCCCHCGGLGLPHLAFRHLRCPSVSNTSTWGWHKTCGRATRSGVLSENQVCYLRPSKDTKLIFLCNWILTMVTSCLHHNCMNFRALIQVFHQDFHFNPFDFITF